MAELFTMIPSVILDRNVNDFKLDKTQQNIYRRKGFP